MNGQKKKKKNIFLKNIIYTRLSDTIAEVLQQMSIIEAASQLNELSTIGKARIADDFLKYGLEVVDFLVGNLSLPGKLQKILDETAKIGGHTTEVNEGYQEIKEKMTDNLSTGNVPVADLNKASKLMIEAHKLAKELPDAPQRKSALNMLGISRKSSPLDCWTDYERVPGTKEFSKGSCRKK